MQRCRFGSLGFRRFRGEEFSDFMVPGFRGKVVSDIGFGALNPKP